MHGPDPTGGHGRNLATGAGGRGLERWGAGHGRDGPLGRPPAPALERLIDEVLALTDRSFGVIFVVSDEHLEATDSECFALAAQRARVREFFWGWPDPATVAAVHAEGALVSWQGGSTAEAVDAVETGVDLIVAQGTGAGGDVRSTIVVLALPDEVLDAVGVPVLAAGGIGSGRALAVVLAAGAAGARMGTRFVVAEESDAHPRYNEAPIAARAADTVRGSTFTGWWDAPGRVLRSSADAATTFEGDIVGETPSLDGTREALHRLCPEAINRGTTGAIEAMLLWAGESVIGVRHAQPAEAIVRELAGEAERLLRRWGRPEPTSAVRTANQEGDAR